MIAPGRPRAGRGGFTLVEMACASALMGVLAALMVLAWSAFGVPAVEVYRRGRVAREAGLAAAALAADLGGYPADAAGRAGPKDRGRLVDWMAPGGAQLRLCFDGGAAPDGFAAWAAPDTVVVYELDGDRLVRRDEATGAAVTVAGDVAALAVADPDGSGRRMQVVLTFLNRQVGRTYTLVATKPQD